MSELREPGDIEQDTPVAMLLWNLSEENERYRGVKVEKDWQGKIAKFQTEFVDEEMSSKEVEGKDPDFEPTKERTLLDQQEVNVIEDPEVRQGSEMFVGVWRLFEQRLPVGEPDDDKYWEETVGVVKCFTIKYPDSFSKNIAMMVLTEIERRGKR